MFYSNVDIKLSVQSGFVEKIRAPSSDIGLVTLTDFGLPVYAVVAVIVWWLDLPLHMQ
jgi:ActR/RegA family two-component response regulator